MQVLVRGIYTILKFVDDFLAVVAVYCGANGKLTNSHLARPQEELTDEISHGLIY
jgi:hypothetical protein